MKLSTSKRGGNPCPTAQLADQLTRTARLTAEGRGPCEKSSATINHGIDPGPMAKNTINNIIAAMLTYLSQSTCDCRTNVTVITIVNTNMPPSPSRCKNRRPRFSIRGIETRVITTMIRPINGVAYSAFKISRPIRFLLISI